MADNRVEIQLRLTGSEKAAAGVRALAGDTQKAAAAQKDANKQFDAGAEALKRLQAAQREVQVRRHLEELDPGGRLRGRAGGGGFLQSGKVGQVLGVTLGAAAVSQAAAGVGSALSGIAAEQSGSLGGAMAQIAGEVGAALPVIGGFARGIGEAADALSGLASAAAGAQRWLSTASRMIGSEAEKRGIRFGAAEEVADLRRDQATAQAKADAAAAARARLTPEVLASFRPEVRPGQATEGTGEARFGVFNAVTAVDEAQRVLAQRKKELAAFRGGGGEVEQLQARIADQQRAADEAQRRKDEAQRALDANWKWGSRGWREQRKDLTEAAADAAKQQEQLKELQKDREAQITAEKKRQQAVMEAQKALAQAQYELAGKKIERDRDSLALVQQQVDRAKQGLQQLGMGGPGEAEQLLAIRKQAERGGFDSLSPEDKQKLAGNAITADYASRAARESMMNNPAARELMRMEGMADLSSLEAQANRLKDQIKQSMIEQSSAMAEAIAGAMRENLPPLTDLIAEKVKAAITVVTASTQRQLDEAALQGQARQ